MIERNCNVHTVVVLEVEVEVEIENCTCQGCSATHSLIHQPRVDCRRGSFQAGSSESMTSQQCWFGQCQRIVDTPSSSCLKAHTHCLGNRVIIVHGRGSITLLHLPRQSRFSHFQVSLCLCLCLCLSLAAIGSNASKFKHSYLSTMSQQKKGHFEQNLKRRGALDSNFEYAFPVYVLVRGLTLIVVSTM